MDMLDPWMRMFPFVFFQMTGVVHGTLPIIPDPQKVDSTSRRLKKRPAEQRMASRRSHGFFDHGL